MNEIDKLGDQSDSISSFIQNLREKDDIPGISVSVVDGEEVRYAKGFGMRDIANEEPATPQTLYGIGSCTKSFTALAVLKLVEAGELELDDPVSDYIDYTLGESDNPITVESLMTHSSGAPSDGALEVVLNKEAGYEKKDVDLQTMEDFYDFVNGADDEITGPPGEEFFYYNSGFTLLGELVATVSGEKFADFIRQEILNPLDMERSSFSEQEVSNDPDHMTPYHVEDGDVEERPLFFHPVLEAPGGLYSSVEEMANYLLMHMNNGEYVGDQIVAPELLEKMHTGMIERSGGEYGYGWIVTDIFGEKLVNHDGNMNISSGYLGFTEDYGVAIGCNTKPPYYLDQIGMGILAILMGREPQELPYFALRNKLERLVGKYRSYQGVIQIDVSRDGGKLVISSERFPERDMFSGPLFAENQNPEDLSFYHFDNSGEKEDVRFEEQEDGSFDMYYGRWRLHQQEASRGSK
ncbi:MAG: serine hydrolase [Candidatus Nanohaloarchaea archaeon]